MDVYQSDVREPEKWLRTRARPLPLTSLNGKIPLRDSTQHMIRTSGLSSRFQPENWHCFALESLRVLKSGGWLQIIDYDFGGTRIWEDASEHLHSVTSNTYDPYFLSLLEEAGFQEVTMTKEEQPADENMRTCLVDLVYIMVDIFGSRSNALEVKNELESNSEGLRVT